MYFGVSDAMRSPAQKSGIKSSTKTGVNGRLKVSGRAGVVSAHESGDQSSSKLTGGLGFSEFIEFVAKIALLGMDGPNYHILFPTPFSKVSCEIFAVVYSINLYKGSCDAVCLGNS
jgi:hypothetical protein